MGKSFSYECLAGCLVRILSHHLCFCFFLADVYVMVTIHGYHRYLSPKSIVYVCMYGVCVDDGYGRWKWNEMNLVVGCKNTKTRKDVLTVIWSKEEGKNWITKLQNLCMWMLSKWKWNELKTNKQKIQNLETNWKKKQDRHREEEEKSIYVIKFEKNRRKTEKQKNSCPIELKIWADRRFI